MPPFIGSTFAPNSFTIACHHMHWSWLRKLSHYKSGTLPVCFSFQNECAQALIRAGNRWAVNPQLELIDNLGKLTGEDKVELDKTIVLLYRKSIVFCLCL